MPLSRMDVLLFYSGLSDGQSRLFRFPREFRYLEFGHLYSNEIEILYRLFYLKFQGDSFYHLKCRQHLALSPYFTCRYRDLRLLW